MLQEEVICLLPMSRRTRATVSEVDAMRAELVELKNAAATVGENGNSGPHTSEFDKLSPVEQSAASLGVNPAEWKPISFLNNGHYQQLISANMLDDSLARRIEAFRTVAASE